ncbi:MAG: hypothetical protein ISQ75_00200 [Puniceicoccaceae bacterium]|nr:hypothetical protein [Puniceicoccaceae bacterium]
MQSDDDLQTTLSKWPFILGDVLLVATALAIAILGQWQLTNWQVAACVVSVALGAALFVLPYVVEFKVRVREEVDDRTGNLRILQRHLVSTQDQLEAVSDRIESIEASLTNLAHAQPDLSGPLEALEGQMDPLRTAQAEQSSQLAALAKQADALDKQVEALAKSLQSKSEAEAIEALRLDLAALKTDAAQLAVKAAESPVEAAESSVEVAESPVEVSEVSELVSPAEGSSEVPMSKKTREPRRRRTPEPRLLERAIDQKRDHASAAVSRIIESKKKEPPSEPQSENEAAAAPSVMLAEEAVKEDGLVEAQDMFADAVPSQADKRARIKKSDTAVIASVFIGIGNKPYLRGGGAGLNWARGMPMEFEEIGKWRWLAPADLEAPVEIQLYRNDEDPDSTGKYTLEPGQQLELSPVF